MFIIINAISLPSCFMTACQQSALAPARLPLQKWGWGVSTFWDDFISDITPDCVLPPPSSAIFYSLDMTSKVSILSPEPN